MPLWTKYYSFSFPSEIWSWFYSFLLNWVEKKQKAKRKQEYILSGCSKLGQYFLYESEKIYISITFIYLYMYKYMYVEIFIYLNMQVFSYESICIDIDIHVWPMLKNDI